MEEEESVEENKSEALQGTLDLIALKTLETMGPRHGQNVLPYCATP